MTRKEIQQLRGFNEEQNNGYQIGRGREYFTLWYISYDEEKERYYCQYVQNLMKTNDKEKVRMTFPNLGIDTSLFGHHSFYRKEAVKAVDLTVWPFGKYKGQRIEDCEDDSYLTWAIRNAYEYRGEDFSGEIAKALVKRGYALRDGMWMTAEEMAKYGRADRMLESQTPFEFRATGFDADEEDDEYGYTRVDGIPYPVALPCKHYSGTYYHSGYSLPIIDGKPKRVKGKTIRVTKYHDRNGCWIADEYGLTDK